MSASSNTSDQTSHTNPYNTAVSRNIGWVTQDEQASLRTKRIAIAGMGGVGGSHLLTLTRLGIGAFHIADFDVFELANFNRQIGARMSSVGQPKVDTLAEMALDINPDLNIQRFPDGINPDNVEQFLRDVDVYIDGLDFFAVPARRMVFEACDRLSIPAITAAPLGMGAALLNFLPGKTTFEEYFRMENQPEEEQLRRFLMGLAPQALHAQYLVDPTAIDLVNRCGPSTPMGCELCAGVVGSQVLKILVGRGEVIPAPHGLQFDAFMNQCVVTHWQHWENHDPAQPIGTT